MAKIDSKQKIFHILNEKFDNYACSSGMFKPAGLYIMVTTVYTFISNIYRFITMLMERTEVIRRDHSHNLYELTKLAIFNEIPWLNVNVYDILLIVQYCETLRLYWVYKDLMQDNFISLQGQCDSSIFVQYPIRFLVAVARCLFSENYSIEPAWIANEIFALLLKIVDWSMLRCYVFNATI